MKHNATLRPDKCELGQPKVKWLGNIYPKDSILPDPKKCQIIKNWPFPKCTADVKSFLQTVQFNRKFLDGQSSKRSYPELTELLRALTKKNAWFIWNTESSAFKEIQKRLCYTTVLASWHKTPDETVRRLQPYWNPSNTCSSIWN